MSTNPRESPIPDLMRSRDQLVDFDTDRELLAATKTLKLFTFTKTSALDSDFDLHREKSISYQKIDQAGPSSRQMSMADSSKNRPVPPEPQERTADELLRMLNSKASSRHYKLTPPPPLPPKPKIDRLPSTGMGSNNGASERSFRDYSLIKANKDSSDGRINKLAANRNSDFMPTMKPDNYHDFIDPATRLSSNVSNNADYLHQKLFERKRLTIDNQDDSGDSSIRAISRPIVTESPEEANNNHVTMRNRCTNTSTVEILELPPKYKLHSTTYGDIGGNPTFSRSQREQLSESLFYENNASYAVPIITPATDDDDYDGEDHIDNRDRLPTEVEVESILNESSSKNLPRTSTPNTVQSQQNSASSTPTATNANSASTSQNTFVDVIGQGLEGSDEQTDEDVMNISKDTDNSAMNQSGGCELIGVNDNSDRTNSSKGSPHALNSHQDKVLYTVNMSESIIPSPSHRATTVNDCKDSSTGLQDSFCQDKVKKLETSTICMQNHIEKLEFQITRLNSRILELESRLDAQQKIAKSTSDSDTSRQKPNYLTSLNASNGETSQFSLAANKSSPHDSCPIPTSTYSRNHVATILRNAQPPPAHTPSKLLSTSMSNGRLSSPQSSNSTISKSLKKLNIHASTNSLYGGGSKSGSTSVSPTPNYQEYRQSTSPTSIMSLSGKRDPMAYTSMLSLSSLGGSTLKKSSAASGSVSNLSQVGSQLMNWPSVSDFVPGKHQAKDIVYSSEERMIRMVLYNASIMMRLPDWVESNYNIDKVVEPPTVRLKLDWVHGYRGRDCRSNIFYLPTNECVYFVASIVVLYNPTDKTQRHYLGHTDSVKCLAVHPNQLIIASGQSAVLNRRDKRPIVRVWNTVTLATLRVIGFNEDFDRSICCLAFSKHDQGATLAVVDESNEHTITLLDWQRERNWRLAETNSGHEPVLAIDFHPMDKCSLIAVGKSTINFWDTRGMTLAKKTGLFDKFDKPKYVLCLAFNNLGDTITGDSNGNVIIWPRGSNRPKRVIHDAHKGGVFSVLAMKNGSYLTGGGRDRRIVEWDENFSRTGREAELPEHCGGVRFITYARASQILIGTLRNSILIGSLDENFKLIMQGHTEATTSLAIHPNQPQYLTGGFDDQIHLFDTRTHDVVWSKCLMMPATAACFSPNGFLLVVGSTLGKWLVIDAVSQEILFTKCDGSGTISCVKFSPDGQFFSMGSSDSQIYVYQVCEAGSKFFRTGTCVGHTGPVKEIDWSDDSRYMQSQSTCFELLFWRAANCRPLVEESIIDNLRWSTHNCTLGFSVFGIWSDSIDSALINYCDKSNNDDLMVSVTDTGNINIFKWPPCYNQCLSQKYYGNIDKFDMIKFLPDDSRLIAVGAKNCTTTEWIVDKGEPLEKC